MGIIEVEDDGAFCGGDVPGGVGAKELGTVSGVANAGTVALCLAGRSAWGSASVDREPSINGSASDSGPML